MENNYITEITLNTIMQDGEEKLQATVKNVTFTKLLQILLPFLVSKAKEVLVKARQDQPDQNEEDLKLAMYDMMNIAFSNALSMFAPEIEARPDLTEDAILKAQDDLLKADMRRIDAEARKSKGKNSKYKNRSRR